MKTYTSSEQLRLVGKAWEIRAMLRQWAKQPITLQEWLQRRHRAVHYRAD
ncbi:Z-ring formation inhibitor MciZ [Brevibacillus fulvus]|uniref:Z-ring formation inhibitor MciZ n=1 Tax=Brevibacillus fulvus TaxID=1125967 RepID=A0A939BQP9_9BACL|nr:Z-ring formation inhibitor MciZ [Brevibacillus fulvus]MBM7588618.1 hypothetical protein [Brevibacillus fulvus]